ncbi:hypothetical protein S83_035103, partial [Arachis hypogaea]
MKCPEDITTFNWLKQEKRLYQFLTGIDNKFDTVRRDLLKQEPAPSVESAYATIRREAARLQILKHTTDGVREASQGEIRTGLAAKNRTDQGGQGHGRSDTVGRWSSSRGKEREDKSHLYCTHCGMNKHTKETCFRIVGYLEWWEDNHKKSKNKSSQGRGATAVGIPEVTSSSGTGEEEGENRRTQHGKASVAVTQQGKIEKEG